MTARQYQAIAELLDQAEAITTQYPLLTHEGRLIQAQIKELLIKVAAEQMRVTQRESIGKPTPKTPASET
jgi:hypothetical protein